MTDAPAPPAPATAALLVIGDEILSGRTKDKNIGHVAEALTGHGIDLVEVRVVPDDEARIVEAITALRARATYLVTTGGIGPTHDDITADCVAKALGRPIDVDPRALAMLHERIRPQDMTPARLRMARVPEGATLIENPISKAPGFLVDGVLVMAGVPAIMQAMLANALPHLKGGAVVLSRSVEAGGMPEGLYGDALGALARAHGGVSIGSYPSMTPEGFRNQVVVRGRDEAKVEAAAEAVRAMLAGLGGGDGAPA